MEIFKNDMGYVPMITNLEGYWDKTLADLPDKLRKVVERRYDVLSWDNLSQSHRRSLAAQFDYQHDPYLEASLYFEMDVF